MPVDLQKVLEFLETYRGRDKVLRTLCYVSKLVSGLSRSEGVSSSLDKFGSQLSACRATLRLLDDVPMLAYAAEYGLGSQEKDDCIRFSNLLANIVDLIFYPIDHMSWAIDYNIINSTDTRWGTASTVCWTISLYLTIAKSMRGLHLLAEEKNRISTGDRSEIAALSKKEKALIIAALRASADLLYAVHYLPEGILWSGTLKKWQVGALGSFSSILGLYQAFS